MHRVALDSAALRVECELHYPKSTSDFTLSDLLQTPELSVRITHAPEWLFNVCAEFQIQLADASSWHVLMTPKLKLIHWNGKLPGAYVTIITSREMSTLTIPVVNRNYVAPSTYMQIICAINEHYLALWRPQFEAYQTKFEEFHATGFSNGPSAPLRIITLEPCRFSNQTHSRLRSLYKIASAPDWIQESPGSIFCFNNEIWSIEKLCFNPDSSELPARPRTIAIPDNPELTDAGTTDLSSENVAELCNAFNAQLRALLDFPQIETLSSDRLELDYLERDGYLFVRARSIPAWLDSKCQFYSNGQICRISNYSGSRHKASYGVDVGPGAISIKLDPHSVCRPRVCLLPLAVVQRLVADFNEQATHLRKPYAQVIRESSIIPPLRLFRLI